MIDHLLMLTGRIVSSQEHMVIVDHDVDVAASVGHVQRVSCFICQKDTQELFNKLADLGTHEFPRPERHRVG